MDHIKYLHDNGISVVRRMSSVIHMKDGEEYNHRCSYAFIMKDGDEIDVFFDRYATEQQTAEYFVHTQEIPLG